MIRRATRGPWPAALLALLIAAVVLAIGSGSLPPALADAAWPQGAASAAPAPVGHGPLPQLPPQDNDLPFDRLSFEEGLSHSTVRCVFQDGQGFLWFGTDDGLNKYDGYGFTVYRHDPDDPAGLRDDVVLSIYQDRSGVLWVGTREALHRFDRHLERFTPYPSAAVLSIHEDRSGAFWVGTLDALFAFDRDTGQFTRVRMGATQVIYEDQAGRLWFGTVDRGLDRYDGQAKQALDRYDADLFVHYDARDPDGLSGNSVGAIYQDGEGVLWIGTDGGLDRLDPETEQLTHYANDPADPYSLSGGAVSSILEDRAGALWLGTYGGGLNRFDRGTGRFAHYRNDRSDPYSLSTDNILAMAQDRSGILWIGTWGGGVSKLDQARGRFRYYRSIPGALEALGDDSVTAVFEDDEGVLWVGTAGGLDRFDREGGHWLHYQNDPSDPHSLSDNSVSAILEDEAGVLWIGTYGGGLNRFDRRTERFTSYRRDRDDLHSLGSDFVHAIVQDRSGVLWIGTQGAGLDRFDAESEHFVHYQHGYGGRLTPARNAVQCIHQDDRGILWLGTQAGLDRFDPETEQFTLYTHDPDDPTSLSANDVLAVREDSSAALWIGTGGGGLNRLDRETGAFTHYRERDGLQSDVVAGIMEDEQGFLWLSTSKGISRFDPGSGEFRNYDRADGLEGSAFVEGAHHQSSAGEIFVGSVNGLIVFHPEEMTDNPHVPPIVITAFSQFNQVVRRDLAADEHITLSYRDNYISFDFAALDYHAPQRNQYAYMLEGLDGDWVYAGTRRHVDYPNLRPGEYVFRVLGSNNDGLWNEAGTSVRVSVTPPFWETWWFIGLSVLALAAGAVAAYRLRVRGIEARSRELEKQMAERTAELQREIEQRLQAEESLRQGEMEQAVAAERTRLARELHDAVTQTLFSAGLIAEVLPQVWATNPEQGRQQLEEVRLLTRGALAEMRTLLLELRPEALTKARMSDLLGQLARAMTGRTGVPVAVTAEGQATLPPTVRVALYRIAQESLNNAARHADAGQVEMRFTRAPGRATLSIRDDGRGFDVERVPQGRFGLENMRERAAAIGATIEISSQPGAGTQVTVDWQEQLEERGNDRSEADSGPDRR